MAGQTTRHALPYPGLDDQPDGPDAIKDLAEAVDALLSRLKSYPTAGRPVGVPEGFVIYDSDLDAPYYWNGSVWQPFGGGGGGGGGGTGGAHVTQTSPQNIPNTSSGPGTILSLPNGDDGDLVERSAQGAGHKFRLLAGGAWAAGSSCRIASTSTGGEISCSIRADLTGGTNFDTVIAVDGGRREGLPRTLQPNRTRPFLPANTMIAVFIFNGTGSQRVVEPNGGEWANLDLTYLG